MKNNLPFFSHDNDAYDHPKHRALRARFGWEGYGRFWALNELIAQAEGCQLDIQRPINRAKVADEIGLSDSDFTDFITFLSDSELCGLVHMLKGFLTTDRTQEDYERVMRTRLLDRKRTRKQTRAGNGQFRPENAENQPGPTAEQSREDIDDDGEPRFLTQPEKKEIRPENETDSIALCSALSGAAPAGLTISDQLLKDFSARLAFENLDLGYIRWFGDYVRRQPKLENKAGYFRAHFGELGEQYRISQQRAAAPPAPQEPDNPQVVEQLLEKLPWHPEKKRRGDPAPPASAGAELPAFE